MADGDAYLDGAAYVSHDALDAQTTFRLAYSPRHMVVDLFKTAIGWAGAGVAAALLFVLPGWALLAWLWPGRPLAWAETLGLAVGLSLALYPLLLLWTDLVGLHLGQWYAWLPAGISTAALLWRYRAWRPAGARGEFRDWLGSERLWPDATLLIILGLVFAARLIVVRTLKVPMWGDSYQHTMIAQLIAENGGLFDSWEPYVPLQSFTYHFGFHSAVGAFHWLTGTSTMNSVILVGQLVNGFAALALYPLAVKVSHSRWAGVIAVAVAGLLSPMPMFYVNWGRYVQLAGQVILPVAVWLTWCALESRPRRLWLEVLTATSVAGLFLTHYRVTVYYLCFLAIAWAASSVHTWKAGARLREPAFRTLTISGISVALALPWIWHLFSGALPAVLEELARAQGQAFSPSQTAILASATTYTPVALIIASLLGALAGIVRRRVEIVLIVVWVALLFLAANPNWVGLPGAATVSNFEGVVNNFTVLISLYMPAALLCGYLGSVGIQALCERVPRLRPMAIAGAILVMAILGASSRLHTLDSKYTLVTEPDVQAMAWIEDNTPVSARFLTNSFFAYGDNVIVGSDAGWWIPLLAHRQNTTPPITYGHETAYEPGFAEQVNSLARFVEDHGLRAPETVELLRSNNITHIYVGQTGGSLDPEEIDGTAEYRLRYHEDRIWIFEVQ
jgi:hypothetical protein